MAVTVTTEAIKALRLCLPEDAPDYDKMRASIAAPAPSFTIDDTTAIRWMLLSGEAVKQAMSKPKKPMRGIPALFTLKAGVLDVTAFGRRIEQLLQEAAK